MDVICVFSMLYYSETLDKDVQIRRAYMNGSDDRPLIASRDKRDSTCSCQNTWLPLFVLDHSKKEAVQIYVIDSVTSSIYAMDTEGCHCRLVVDANNTNYAGTLHYAYR